MVTTADAELLASAIRVPGRLVLAPNSNTGSFPYGGKPIGVRREADLEWISREQEIRDPLSGALLNVIRRMTEQPRLFYLLEPPFDQNAVNKIFNTTVPANSLPYQSPAETRAQGSVIVDPIVRPISSPLGFIADDPRHLSVYFPMCVSRLSLRSATRLSLGTPGWLPIVFDPLATVDSSDPGFPYIGSTAFWQVCRWENMVLVGGSIPPIPPVPPPPAGGTFIVTTVSLVLTSANVGFTYSNAGSSGGITITLPDSGNPGDVINFLVESAQELKVQATSGETIQSGGLLSATGGFIESSTVGSTLALERTSATTWVMRVETGNWSVDS